MSGIDGDTHTALVYQACSCALLCRGRRVRRLKQPQANRGERVTDMVTADKLMVALIGRRTGSGA